MMKEDRGGSQISRPKFKSSKVCEIQKVWLDVFGVNILIGAWAMKRSFLSKLIPGFCSYLRKRYRRVDSKLIVQTLQLLVFYLHCSLVVD
jgi:hypothetical protein